MELTIFDDIKAVALNGSIKPNFWRERLTINDMTDELAFAIKVNQGLNEMADDDKN